MSDPIKELLDRCRRMETRLTRFLETQGFDTKVRRPDFINGMVNIPSMSCSIQDCMTAVPEDWRDRDVAVYHQNEFVVSLRFPSADR